MSAVLEALSPSELAYGDLLCYARAQWPQIRIGEHHKLLADLFMDLERGQINRLRRWNVKWPDGRRIRAGENLDRVIVTTPPRHTKTLLFSTYGPAWWLGRNPDDYVISATYNDERATDVGRAVRNLIETRDHWATFGQRTAGDSRSFHKFALSNGRGEYFGVGRGGPITGRGGHLMLVDDPYKNRKEAESDAIRREIRDWWSSVVYTRLMPGARIALIMTRWDQTDLGGWLLDEYRDDGWLVVNLPALALKDDPLRRERGAALWADQYDVKALRRIKRSILPRDWQAMYQGKPTTESGGFFRKQWVGYRTQLPPNLKLYGASDYAVTDEGGDYTEHGIFGISRNGYLYPVDWWSGQTSSDEWIEAQLDMVQRWRGRGLTGWYGEGGVIQKAVEPFLKRRMRERGLFVNMRWLPSIHDKPTRARSFQAFMGLGRVRWPRTEWAQEVITQLLAFPNGTFDDKVDTCSLIGRAANRLLEPPKPPGRTSRGIKPFSVEWLMYDEDKKDGINRRL